MDFNTHLLIKKS